MTTETAVSKEKPKVYDITIDRGRFKVKKEKLTGVQLRALPDPDISQDYELRLEKGKVDPEIGDDESVKMKDGLHFFSVPRQINPGASR